jgi:hypothetical protein
VLAILIYHATYCDGALNIRGYEMKILSAYCLQAELGTEATADRAAYAENEICEWLYSKGAISPLQSEGKFNSLSRDGSGSYSINSTKSEIGTLMQTTLTENVNNGYVFVTNIYCASTKSDLTIYATLAIESDTGLVKPAFLYPKCPKVIRSLISNFNDWKYYGQPIPKHLAIIYHENEIAHLCAWIRNNTRKLPILAVSADREEMIWHDIYVDLARDLAGIAYVVVLDEQASWALTDEFGKTNSCYLGAIRLYWPVGDSDLQSLSLSGSVWTSRTILSSYGSNDIAKRKFLSMVRSTILSAAAATIGEPSIISEITFSSFKEGIQRIVSRERETAKESAESEIDAELEKIAAEESRIAKENFELKAKISALEWSMERKCDNCRWKIDEDIISDDSPTPPEKGEIRFYKKIGTKGPADEMEHVNGCNHNAWRPAFKGDKAEKGIAKLEGRSDWQSIQHCGTCTGGGVWRVHW